MGSSIVKLFPKTRLDLLGSPAHSELRGRPQIRGGRAKTVWGGRTCWGYGRGKDGDYPMGGRGKTIEADEIFIGGRDKDGRGR